jgi:hypothetical protein
VNRLQSVQLALILDSTAVDEGFFLLVFLRWVRNRAWGSGVTQKQAEENRARRKGSVG